MFSPLAFTKNLVDGRGRRAWDHPLVPVLMGFFIRGKIPDEKANPINRLLIRLYEPLLDKVLTFPKTTLALACLLLIATLWPLSRLGSEFMPPLDEEDLLYMPSTLPGISAREASRLLQQTDRLIKASRRSRACLAKPVARSRQPIPRH